MSVRKGGMIIAGNVADAQRVSNMEQVVSTATNKYPSSKAVNDLVPVGTMIIWGAPTPPAGRWIIANGAAISRTTYAELFAVYGTTWGAGDGNTTFNLPNKQVLSHKVVGNGRSLGFQSIKGVMSQEEANDGLTAVYDNDKGMLLVATSDAVNKEVGTMVNFNLPSTTERVAMGLSTDSMFSNVIVEADVNLYYYIKY